MTRLRLILRVLSWVGRLGIGVIKGLSRNSEGKVLLQFAKEVCVNSAIHVKLLALREEILLAAASYGSKIYFS